MLALAVVTYVLRPAERPPRLGLDHIDPAGSSAFLDTVAGVTGAMFVPGNTVTILNNGDEFFPAMLEAIRGAHDSVCIEQYIFWEGQTADQFCEALAERARAGVPVKLLLDSVGSATHRRTGLRGPDRRRLRSGVVHADPVVHDRALQQPHAPQDAGRGWQGRLHRWRRHRRPLAWHRDAARRVARHDVPDRGAGRGEPAVGICAELAADDPGDHPGRPSTFPRCRPPDRWRCRSCTVHRTLARRRRV